MYLMTFYCILGRVPELSIAELLAVFKARGISLYNPRLSPSVFTAETTQPFDVKKLLSAVGGVIKMGVVSHYSAPSLSADSADVLIREFLSTMDTDKRITFGLSAYTLTQSGFSGHGSKKIHWALTDLGLSVKKIMKESGDSARFVSPRPGTTMLSSVVVEKEKLLASQGCEIVALIDQDSVHFGKTLAVQEFEEYSFRDWNRPARSMDVGLLPPKIAQAMINLADLSPQDNPHLLDPFCGFGTILQEALLLGYHRVSGSDLNSHNINATRENLSWLSSKTTVSLANVNVTVRNAEMLARHYKVGGVDAIVTEPYLGPVVKKSGPQNLSAISKELERLYLSFFKEAHKILSPNGSVVIVFPVWIHGVKKTFLPIIEKIQRAGFTLTAPNVPQFGNLTDRKSILIFREGQHVARELFVFRKA